MRYRGRSSADPTTRRHSPRADRDDSTQATPAIALQRLVGNQAVARLADASADVDSAATGAGGQAWLRPGDSGPAVADVRTQLNAVGGVGTPLAPGDRFDGAMTTAVREFQISEGLNPDSIIGPLTWEALDRHAGTAAETVAVGTDHHGEADRPADTELGAIKTSLNPTSTGPTGEALDWDGRSDVAEREALRAELRAALQSHLDGKTPGMIAREQAKAAGNVVTTQDLEGAGRAAKSSVDDVFGELAAAAVLTTSQEQGRAAFDFTAGVNLLDASDPSVRPPKPRDLAEWMAETDRDASGVQTAHHFNRRRVGQGEPPFFDEIIDEFIATGSNLSDLTRYDLFGFAFALAGPRVLIQVALVGSDEFSSTPDQPGGMSDAERRRRWSAWQVLVHEYIHTLAHPEFNRSHGGNRILVEGFCELFTKAVLVTAGGIASAQADADPALRSVVEGGDVPDFDARFVPDFDPGVYESFLARAEEIVGQVGMDAARAAFFLGHVELIGLEPGGDGTVIDPTAPDAADHLGPDRVVVPDVISTVNGVSIMTGAPVADIVAANPGLGADTPLPTAAHSDGIDVPGTVHHRTLAARSRTERAVETKAVISAQHGVTIDALVRANPALNHREPREGEWILIPVH